MILKLSKFAYTLLLFYLLWFQPVFFSIPKMPLLLGFVMIFLLLLHKYSKDGKLIFRFSEPVLIWITFAFYCLFSGYFVAVYPSLLVGALQTFAQTLLLIVYVIEVSHMEKSNIFFVRTYLILSYLYLGTFLLFGYDELGRHMISADSNPNTDGMIMLYGLFVVLLTIKPSKVFSVVSSLAIIGLFSYAIILTGSRKTFIALIILILFGLYQLYLKTRKQLSVAKRTSIIILVIISVIFVGMNSLVFFEESTLISRLEIASEEGDSNVRFSLYREALEFFSKSPLTGIGYSQFMYRSKFNFYSHSTYAEILSCTGIIGTILYFAPYLMIIKNLILSNVISMRQNMDSNARLYLSLMAAMLFLGLGMIHSYSIYSFIMFALMISDYEQQSLSFKKY